jgi:transcriptional regulator with XRE-family HTH domain
LLRAAFLPAAAMTAEATGIAARLRAVREGLQLTQADMAAQMRISLRAYQTYEGGSRQPRAKDVAELAQAGIDLNWLLTGHGEMRRPGAAESARDWGSDLDEVERLIEDEDVPITQEIRRRRPELDAAHQAVLRIAKRGDLPPDVRARADLMLDIAFGDNAAAQRRENLHDDIAARLREAFSIVQEAEIRAGCLLPRNVAMALRDMVFVAGVSGDQVQFLIEAMKTDFAAAEHSKPK